MFNFTFNKKYKKEDTETIFLNIKICSFSFEILFFSKPLLEIRRLLAQYRSIYTYQTMTSSDSMGFRRV